MTACAGSSPTSFGSGSRIRSAVSRCLRTRRPSAYGAKTITGFSFDLENLYLANKLGYKIAEVPVAWVDAPGSKLDPTKEAQRFLRDLVKIKMNDLRGVYANA